MVVGAVVVTNRKAQRPSWSIHGKLIPITGIVWRCRHKVLAWRTVDIHDPATGMLRRSKRISIKIGIHIKGIGYALWRDPSRTTHSNRDCSCVIVDGLRTRGT